jgi:glutamate-1-semialdehyde 2,1-aminomutase
VTVPWEERFAEAAQASGKIHRDATRVIAGGMTHDVRFATPFPLSIERANGPRKWDPDGNEYIDYVVGHGALILGHGHPATVEAVRDQVGRGTHYGASHQSEVEWAGLVCDLVPSAERVRFTSSGTEAAMLAVRVARAFTARPKILKFHIHFHGWSEVGVVGLAEPFEIPPTVGLTEGMTADVVSMSPREPDAIEARLAEGDVAAVILEPSGAHFGQVPIDEAFLRFLSEVTKRHETLLIFDEVVTGFRWAPGGVQEKFGITPDLTTLAKILGGGLPAGAIAGRAEVFERLELRGDPKWDRYEHVFHPGTFNANPLAAAAGIATLKEIATGEPNKKADAAAAALRDAMNEAIGQVGVPAKVYGESSVFHIFLGPEPPEDRRDAALASMRGPIGQALRGALLSHGVDLLVSGGMLSSTHGEAEIEHTVRAFEASLQELAAVQKVPGL